MSDSGGSDLSRGLLHRLAVTAAAASVLAFAPVAFGQQTLDNAALAAGFRVGKEGVQQ